MISSFVKRTALDSLPRVSLIRGIGYRFFEVTALRARLSIQNLIPPPGFRTISTGSVAAGDELGLEPIFFLLPLAILTVFLAS